MQHDVEGWVWLTEQRSEDRAARWTSFAAYASGIAFLVLAHNPLYLFLGLAGFTVAAAATADKRHQHTEVLVRGPTLCLDGVPISASRLAGVRVQGRSLELQVEGQTVQVRPSCAIGDALALLRRAKRLASVNEAKFGPYRGQIHTLPVTRKP